MIVYEIFSTLLSWHIASVSSSMRRNQQLPRDLFSSFSAILQQVARDVNVYLRVSFSREPISSEFLSSHPPQPKTA
jgi:hypothetical protein